jgi:hypothetical protein
MEVIDEKQMEIDTEIDTEMKLIINNNHEQ